MEEALKQTTWTTSPRSLLEVLKVLLRNSFGRRQNSALQEYIETSLMLQYTTIIEPTCWLRIPFSDPMHVHSGHIYVSFAFLLAFFRIIAIELGDFLLNNRVDIKE